MERIASLFVQNTKKSEGSENYKVNFSKYERELKRGKITSWASFPSNATALSQKALPMIMDIYGE